MALSTNKEEILSDDYEEGEILDEDNLYDNVSSSEEYSIEETDSNYLHSSEKNSVIDLTKETKKVKHHRKKEHKCKEDSVCRIERSGKHCYARIRQEKRDTIRPKKEIASEHRDVVDKYTPSSPFRREEVNSFRPTPALKAPRNIPAPKLLYRSDYRDSYEKENRYGYKRYKNLPDKYSQGKNRYQGKSKSQNKGSYYMPNRSRYSIVAPPVYYTSETAVKSVNGVEHSTASDNKSSLLKRLVGSGSAGLKVTDDEKNKEKEGETQKTDLEPKIPPLSVNCGKPLLEDCCSESSSSGTTGAIVPKVEEKVEPVPPKKIEVKWKRSIKEDKDELCLRVEALRSALVRKFRENRKKRLIGQKRAGDFDDSLVDFVLGDESDFEVPDESEESNQKSKSKEETPSNKNGEFPKMIPTDISGDVLKPEDMIIDNVDKSETEVIHDESAVKIDAKVAFQNANFSVNSPLYVPPNFTLPFTNLDPNSGSFSLNLDQVSGQNQNLSMQYNGTICPPVVPLFNSPAQLFDNNLLQRNSGNDKVEPNSPVKLPSQSKFEKRNGISPSKMRKSSEKKKKHKKKPKVKTKRTSSVTTKETRNEFDDESLLREIALMSIKSKSKNGSSLPLNDISDYANTGDVAESQSLPLDDRKNIPLPASPAFAGPTESTLDDEFDEDILRAQALSSLGKQVSETFIDIDAEGESYISLRSQSKLPPPSNFQNALNNKKILLQKSARKKIKAPLLKKQWKQCQNSLIIERRYKLKNKYVRGGKLYVKNETTQQVHPPIPSKSVIPPIPKVAKMVISVNSDSSDESGIEDGQVQEEVQTKSDIEANIDLLLQEAQKNSQLMKTPEVGPINNEGLSPSLPANEKKKPIEESNLEKSCEVNGKNTLQSQKDMMTPKQNKKSCSSCSSSTCSTSTVSGATETPQVLKHLPAWQQEEYRMLKKKIAEKERVLQLARAKLVEPSVEKTKPAVASQKIITISKEIEDGKFIVSDTESEKSGSGLVQVAPMQPSIPGGKTVESKAEIDNTEVKCSIPASGGHISSPSSAKRACDIDQLAVKKLCTGLNSGDLMEDIKSLETKVQAFDENTNEYMALKKKADRIKKLLEITEKKIVFKKNRLLNARKKIEEEEKTLSKKMSSAASPNPSQSDSNKLSKREMELSKLKFKEISLRAQVLFHNFLRDKTPEKMVQHPDPKLVSSKEISPAKSQKLSPIGVRTEPGGIQKLTQPTSNKPVKDTSDNMLKRNFSGKERDRDEWDPHKPVCHFDLNGICRDEECTYQHFKTL